MIGTAKEKNKASVWWLFLFIYYFIHRGLGLSFMINPIAHEAHIYVTGLETI